MEAHSGGRSSETDLEAASGRACVANLKNEIRELSKVQKKGSSRGSSIWRIHPHLRNQDPEAYEPKLVSIGPLHHGKKNLLPMEQVKLENLSYILSGNPGNTLDLFFDEIFGCLCQAREEYAEEIKLSDDEFAKMLVIDGCFIIGSCLEFSPIMDTPIINQVEGGYILLGRDLLLFENQIPFFVLNKLFNKIPSLEEYWVDPSNFVRLILHILGINLPEENFPSDEKVRHLLHLKHLSLDTNFVPNERPTRNYGEWVMFPMKKLTSLICMPFLGLVYLLFFQDCAGLFGFPKGLRHPKMIPSASELIKDGIKFKKKVIPEAYKTTCQLKVSFKDGTLEIPLLLVHGQTCFSLRNLIALEQYCNYIPPIFTSYCMFLDNLINSTEDVSILRRSGVLQNLLGDDIQVSQVFNGLCKNVILDFNQHSYAKLYEEVAMFCEVPHHRWQANLVQNYFRNPWTIFSVMAAVLILIFTGTSTFFAIFPRK